MDTKLISESVQEAIVSNMSERQLRDCMKAGGANQDEIERAVRELQMARLWDCGRVA